MTNYFGTQIIGQRDRSINPYQKCHSKGNQFELGFSLFFLSMMLPNTLNLQLEKWFQAHASIELTCAPHNGILHGTILNCTLYLNQHNVFVLIFKACGMEKKCLLTLYAGHAVTS